MATLTQEQINNYKRMGIPIPAGTTTYGTNTPAATTTPQTTTTPSNFSSTQTTNQTPAKTTTAPAAQTSGIDYDAIQKQIAEISAKTQQIASQVPTATKTSTPAQTATAAQPTASQTAKANISQPTTSTTDGVAELNKSISNISSLYDEANKLTTSVLDSIGQSNDEARKLAEQYQAQSQESLKAYIEQTNALAKQIENLPNAADALNKIREQQGLPQMEQELAGIDNTILTTETLLNNIESDIHTRTEGLPVSEAAANRLIAMESKPLSKQLSEQLTARQRIAAGLEAKQNTVSQYMSAYQEDTQRQQGLISTQLGLAQNQYGAQQDITQTGYQMFSDLQSKINTTQLAKIDLINNTAEKQAELVKMGFDVYQQMRAEEIAQANRGEDFQNALIQMKLQADLNAANPGYYSEIKMDEKSGEYYQVSTNKDNPNDTRISGLGIFGGTGGEENITNETLNEITNEANKLAEDMIMGRKIWAQAWDIMRKKYPELSNEAIDSLLGIENREKYSSKKSASSNFDDYE